jgi:5-methylcytosine-specific restriction endonuclease McrA
MQSIAVKHVAVQRVAKFYSLKCVATGALVRQLDVLAELEHCTDADVLAHVAEIDAREEYLPLGYSSMHDYCVRRLRMSEDRALKRIRVGRIALELPAIFEMVADGRLNLSAVLMLKPKLTPENAAELLAAAALKTNAELELLLAARFPMGSRQADAPSLGLDSVGADDTGGQVAARPPVVPSDASNEAKPMGPLAAPVELATFATASAPGATLYARFTPVSAECASLKGQVAMSAYEQFRRLKVLLGHRVPSGNAALVIEYALKYCVTGLEKQKFAKGVRSRPRTGEPNGRYVPDAIRQAVCERDGGRCTFEGPDGTRCEAEWQLELDHRLPLAQGGETTVANLRLLCRPHNQYEAKRIYGSDFIRTRLEHAKADAAREKARRPRKAGAQIPAMTAADGTPGGSGATPTPPPAEAAPTEQSDSAQAEHGQPSAANNTPAPTRPRHALRAIDADRDVIPWLRALQLSLAEARRGAEFCAHIPDAPLELRVRTALQGLGRARAHRCTHAPSAPS